MHPQAHILEMPNKIKCVTLDNKIAQSKGVDCGANRFLRPVRPSNDRHASEVAVAHASEPDECQEKAGDSSICKSSG